MLRPYRPDDFSVVTKFLGECWCRDTPNNYHPGDFAHWMSSRYRGEGLERHFHIAEEAERIIAVAELDAKSGYYAFVMDSAVRGGDRELEFHRICTATMRARRSGAVRVNLMAGDLAGKICLEQLGFAPADADYAVLVRSLEIVPEPRLPEDFHIRSVAGEHEARRVAEVHKGAFGRNWTEAEYRKVMRTPGFIIENELVAVAPGGRFAAFAVIWPDPVSRSGLFEPVGCDSEFARRGLARALLFAGMKRMKAAGMDTALVGCEPSNAPALGLYRSAGFELFFDTVDYVLD
ncbi:MAG: GNAT family N-acetyltransferase [Pseudomonadota bacterium]